MYDLSLLEAKLEQFPHHYIFLICCLGIFTVFFVPTTLYTKLSLQFSINAPIFLPFTQFFIVSVLTSTTLYRVIFSRKKLTCNIFLYVITAAALLLTIVFDNYSIVYLQSGNLSNSKHAMHNSPRNSFALECLFKSPKLLPVMVGNIVFLKKKYTLTTVIAMALMVCGFVGVSLGDFTGIISLSKNNYLGVLLIMLSMTLEAIVVNLEEYILIYRNAPLLESISVVFSLCTVFSLIFSISSGQMSQTISQFQKLRSTSLANEFLSISYLLLYAVFGAFGFFFVFISVKTFGSFQTVTITSFRKVIQSVILYFFCFRNPFTLWHFVSIFMALSGFTLNVTHSIIPQKNQKSFKQKFYNENSCEASEGARNLNDIEYTIDSNDSNEFSPTYYNINRINEVEYEDIKDMKNSTN